MPSGTGSQPTTHTSASQEALPAAAAAAAAGPAAAAPSPAAAGTHPEGAAAAAALQPLLHVDQSGVDERSGSGSGSGGGKGGGSGNGSGSGGGRGGFGGSSGGDGSGSGSCRRRPGSSRSDQTARQEAHNPQGPTPTPTPTPTPQPQGSNPQPPRQPPNHQPPGPLPPANPTSSPLASLSTACRPLWFLLWLLWVLLLVLPASTLRVLLARGVCPLHPYGWSLREELAISWVRAVWSAGTAGMQEIRLLMRFAAKVGAWLQFDLALQPLSAAVDGVAGFLVSSAETHMLDTVDVAVLFIHGGAFVVGHPLHNLACLRQVIANVENEGVSLRILSLEYSLSPEARHPTALLQALSAYEWLRGGGAPFKAHRYMIVGDSAGGNLALCTAHQLSLARAAATAASKHPAAGTAADPAAICAPSLPPPDALLLTSPWVDLTTTATRRMLNARPELDLVSAVHAAYGAAAYVGPDSLNTLREKSVSPMFITEFKDLVSGYLVVLSGAVELMAEDLQAFLQLLKNGANFPVVAHVEEGMVHSWPWLWPLTGERSLWGLELIASHVVSVARMDVAGTARAAAPE